MSSETVTPAKLFNCRRCGNCCKGYGGTYLTDHDIEKISRYIGTDPQQFVAQYCSLSGKRPVLSQKKDGYCIFWDQLCRIHPVKPLMCRRWPFIESILVDPTNWNIIADSCPGIQTDAPVDALKNYVKLMLAVDRDI